MDSDDQVSVCSEESVTEKSLTYDVSVTYVESSTCDSIISNFNRCQVNAEKSQKSNLSSVAEEIEEEADFINDTETEIPIVQISNVCHLDKMIESVAAPVCNDKKEQKKCDKSTNTENYGNKRKMFRQAKNTHFKYRPYGYNHKHLNYQHNNYYQGSFYNNSQRRQFNYMNRYQNHTFCNKWDCEMRHRQNLHFRNMLFTGIFHFTKFLEYLSQTHF